MSALKIEQRVVVEAMTWLGTPYQHQASLKNIGCDCLGLLRGVWREIYGDEPQLMPPYAARWCDAVVGDPLVEMAEKYFNGSTAQEKIKAGDVLLFKYRDHLPSKHVAIAISASRFIHAYVGRGVVENALSPWWLRHISGIFTWK